MTGVNLRLHLYLNRRPDQLTPEVDFQLLSPHLLHLKKRIFKVQSSWQFLILFLLAWHIAQVSCNFHPFHFNEDSGTEIQFKPNLECYINNVEAFWDIWKRLSKHFGSFPSVLFCPLCLPSIHPLNIHHTCIVYLYMISQIHYLCLHPDSDQKSQSSEHVHLEYYTETNEPNLIVI